MRDTLMDNKNVEKIFLETRYDGTEIDLLPTPIRQYIMEKDEGEICRLLQTYVAQKLDTQAPIFLWTGGKGIYVFHISQQANFLGERTIPCRECFWKADALYPNSTYYYKVTDSLGNESRIDSFKTRNLSVRPISLYCGVNIRDIGGWEAMCGKRVAYGKIYRGGRLDMQKFNEQDACVFKELRIKTEIDLRNPGADDDGQTESCFGKNVSYLRTPITQNCYIFPFFNQMEPYERRFDSRVPQSLKNIFECISNEGNYPIYFHCNAGADRTGTLAFLLNGLLGVSYKDLTKDFELTTFSEIGFRLRSEIQDGHFTDSGVMQDNYYNYVAWGKLHGTMLKAYPTVDGELSSSIKRYLIEVCAVPEMQIEKFRKIMLD